MNVLMSQNYRIMLGKDKTKLIQWEITVTWLEVEIVRRCPPDFLLKYRYDFFTLLILTNTQPFFLVATCLLLKMQVILIIKVCTTIPCQPL